MKKITFDDFPNYRGLRVIWCLCYKDGTVFYVKPAFQSFQKDVESILYPKITKGTTNKARLCRMFSEEGAYLAVLDTFPFIKGPNEHSKIAVRADEYRIKYDNPRMVWDSQQKRRVRNMRGFHAGFYKGIELPEEKNTDFAFQQKKRLDMIVKIIGSKRFTRPDLITRVESSMGTHQCWIDLNRLTDQVLVMLEWLVERYPNNQHLKRQINQLKDRC